MDAVSRAIGCYRDASILKFVREIEFDAEAKKWSGERPLSTPRSIEG
jgi:hypothetical protein